MASRGSICEKAPKDRSPDLKENSTRFLTDTVIFFFKGRPLGNRLFWIVLAGDLTGESVFANPGTVKFSHDKAIFFNKIAYCLIPVLNLHKPFVIVNMSFNNVYLGVKDLPQPAAFILHFQFLKYIIKVYQTLVFNIPFGYYIQRKF